MYLELWNIYRVLPSVAALLKRFIWIYVSLMFNYMFDLMSCKTYYVTKLIIKQYVWCMMKYILRSLLIKAQSPIQFNESLLYFWIHEPIIYSIVMYYSKSIIFANGSMASLVSFTSVTFDSFLILIKLYNFNIKLFIKLLIIVTFNFIQKHYEKSFSL